MTYKTDPRCIALAARQDALYLAMRRTRKHLLDGKTYKPELVIVKFPKEQPTNVSTLRRRKT